MLKNSSFVGLIVLAFSMAAFAGDTSKGVPANAKEISFQEMQARCANPADFDIQKAPENIVIRCMDVSHEWVPTESAAVGFSASRHVTAEVVSSKFAVASSAKDYAIDGESGSCPRYKEVEKSFAIEKAASCADIENIKGDLNDFCSSALEASKGVNGKLINTVDTGKVLDTCKGLSDAAGQPILTTTDSASGKSSK